VTLEGTQLLQSGREGAPDWVSESQSELPQVTCHQTGLGQDLPPYASASAAGVDRVLAWDLGGMSSCSALPLMGCVWASPALLRPQFPTCTQGIDNAMEVAHRLFDWQILQDGEHRELAYVGPGRGFLLRQGQCFLGRSTSACPRPFIHLSFTAV
jgi:hypothetical protein